MLRREKLNYIKWANRIREGRKKGRGTKEYKEDINMADINSTISTL